ncbi:MAG: O-antigen ligase family protein [Thermodesulfobacteriota bacterium]
MSHYLPSPKGIAVAQPRINRLWVLYGVAIGMLFLVATFLPKRFFLAFFMGFLVLPVSLIAKDRKKFFLTILVLAMPLGVSKTFDFSPSAAFRSAFGFTIYLIYLPLLALYVIWIFRRCFGKQPMPISTTGLLSFAGLFCTVLISTIFISEPDASTMYAIFAIFDLTWSGLIFIYFSSEIREIKELRLITALLITIGVGEALMAIGQNLTGTFLGLEFLGARKPIVGYLGLLTLSRVTGTMGHPAALAEFFDLIIPVSFAMIFYPMARRYQLLVGLCVIIEFIGTGMSYSRGGIFWTIMASGAILLFNFCRRQGLVRGLFTTFALGVLTTILLLVIPNPLQKGLLRTEPGTALGRLPLMQVAYNMIGHHPWLGVGLNNYVPVAQKYDFTAEQLTTGWNSAVHNVYLFIAGEIGLIGLFFLLMLVATVFWRLLPALRSTEPLIACVGLGILAALVGHLFHWLTDLSTWTSHRLFWFELGLAVAIGHIAARKANENIPQAQAVTPG